MLKRILSFTLVFALCVSFVTFGARTEKDFNDAFDKDITCANVNIKTTFNVTEISDALKNVLYKDGIFAKDKTTSYDVQFLSDEDFSKLVANSYIETVSVSNPRINTGKITHYTEMDFTGGIPYYINIFSYPQVDQLIYMNYADIPYYQDVVETIKHTLIAREYKDVLNNLPENAKTEIRGDKYIIKLNDKQTKDVLYYNSDLLNDVSVSSIEVPYINPKRSIPLLSDIKIFGSNGLTAQITLDKENNLDKITVSVDINANMYDVLSRLEDEFEDISVLGLTKNNSNFKAVYKAEIDINNINQCSQIPVPDIYNQEVYNYSAELVQEYFMNTLEENKINIYNYNERIYFNDVEPVIEDGRTLVPIRKFLNALGVADEDIVYDEGYITINYKNKKVIKLNVFDTNASITENNITTPVTLDVSAKVTNGRTLVPLRFLSETFNSEVIFQELDENTSFINIVPKY